MSAILNIQIGEHLVILCYSFASASQCNFSHKSEDLSCPSERYLLYREWAHPRSIYKKQPLDLIRWGVAESMPMGDSRLLSDIEVTVFKEYCQWGKLTQTTELHCLEFFIEASLCRHDSLNHCLFDSVSSPFLSQYPMAQSPNTPVTWLVFLAWPVPILSHPISKLRALRESHHWHKLLGGVPGVLCE